MQSLNQCQSRKRRKKNDDDLDEVVYEDVVDQLYADGDETPSGPVDAGTDLIVRNLIDGKEKTYNNVLEYLFQ